MGEKRSSSDVSGGGAGKLAKKAGGGDVAASKKTNGAGVPPRGQDQEGNTYWEVRRRTARPVNQPRTNRRVLTSPSSPGCGAWALRTSAARRW